MVYLYNREARPEGVFGFFRVRPVFCAAGVFCFFQVSSVYCLLSTVFFGRWSGAGSAVRFFGRVVFFSVFLVSGAVVCPRTFLRFCLAVFIIFVNFAVFVNFSDNF